MTGLTPPGPTGSAESDNRAFDRVPVQLSAHVIRHDNSVVACIVRDFSVGGMLLFYPGDSTKNTPNSVSQKEQVVITCKVKQGKVLTLNFEGTVVRVSDTGFAVRLRNPDLNFLQILHKVASIQEKLTVNKLKKPVAAASPDVQREREKLIQDCHQRFMQNLDTLVNMFVGAAVDTMRRPETGKSLTDRNLLSEASRVIESQRETFKMGFKKNVATRLRDYQPVPVKSQDFSELNYSANTLSIVDDDLYEDWLADTTTIDKVQTKCSEALYELGVRLSDLYQAKIDFQNCPYRPALFVDCFDQVLKPFNFAHAVNMACHTAFREVLLKTAGELYKQINDFLIGKNIVPVITYHISKKTGERQAKIHDDSGAVPNEQQNLKDAPEATPAPAATAKSDARPQTKAEQPLPAPQPVDRSQRKPAVKQTPAQPSAATVNNGETASPSILDVVGNLINLRQNASSTPQSGPANNAQLPQTPEFKITEVLAALNTLGADASSSNKPDSRNTKEALIESLRQADGSIKQLGQRESQIIDFSDKVFHLMNDDMQVSDQIKTWINRLEMPILKMALQDEELFLNREHMVRNVINKIAQLEVLVGEAEKNSPQNSMVVNAIEWIIDMVSKEHDGEPDAFDRASHQLDILLQTQQHNFDKNLQTVQRDLAAGKIDLNKSTTTEYTSPWTDSPETQNDWLKRVARIHERDWVVLNDKNDVSPERLRVGVVDKDGNRMALVNLVGNLNRGISFTDMARHLEDGTATYLDSANESAMDRAQYTMLQELHEELLDQAKHDILTGFFNRREFEKQLRKILEPNGDNKLRLIAAFFDLDKFKLINDACGYQSGDELLRKTAELMRAKLPDNAILARLGSDEFGMIIQDASLDDALEYSENLLETVHDSKFTFDDKRFTVAISAGIVHVRKPGESANEIMREAENSCNMAKESGGNRIMVYAAGNRGLSHKQDVLKWAAELDRILEEELLTLSCQRIMPIRGGGMHKNKYEILLRVKDTNGENITSDFVEAAERYNRMQDVDRWVIRKTFDWMAANSRKLEDLEALSINLSGCSLNDQTTLDFVRGEFKRTNIPTNKVCFEITETTGVTSLSSASEFILTLKEIGCRFSLDDFGSGMSSYAYLKNLPVDYLKIDGAFIRDLARNPSDQALVNSICEVGHFMGKKIIAEYVENNSVLKKLQDLRVDYAQGYGVEKPKPLSML